MKKALIAGILAVAAVGTGYFAFQVYGSKGGQTKTGEPDSSAVQSSVPSSQEVSKVSKTVPESSSQVPSKKASTTKPSSSVSVPSAKTQEPALVKKAVKLNWNRYTLKPSAPKELKGKTYNTYQIWDDEYLEGPKILVDPSDGKVYTWTSSDADPIPAEQDQAFDKTPHTIVGTLKDGAMMSIVLTTDDGNELTIRRLGVDTSGLKSMKIGNRIKVTYTGVIRGNDTSRAFVTKLENA